MSTICLKALEVPLATGERLQGFPLDRDHLAIRLAKQVAKVGGRALLVGGVVRDAILGVVPGDVDMEVYGLEADRLEALASQLAPVKAVGKGFAILKVGSLDVSIPRAPRRMGMGTVLQHDPKADLAEAARRRDFTLNAIAWDPLDGEVYDPCDGLLDLRAGLLRHVADDTFVEDPLRALRAIQFLARLDVELAPETRALCRNVAVKLPGIPKERIFGELQKLLIKGKRVGKALSVAQELGIVASLWPDLEALVGCRQDSVWHPEGDVFRHTCLSLDRMAEGRTGDAHEDWIVALAVLCHDLGKASTTEIGADGRIRSHKHDVEGGHLAEAMLSRMTGEHKLVRVVRQLVQEHLRPSAFFQQAVSDAAIRRLSTRTSIALLVRVARADHLGRGLVERLVGKFEAGDWLLARARELDVLSDRPVPLLQGRALLSEGMKPGPEVGALLERLYEAQLAGTIRTQEEGVALARKWMTPVVDSLPSVSGETVLAGARKRRR